MPRQYDILVFGGSGVTGQRVIAEVAASAGLEHCSFAVAGRSEPKLRAVLDRLGIKADVSTSAAGSSHGPHHQSRMSLPHTHSHVLLGAL